MGTLSPALAAFGKSDGGPRVEASAAVSELSTFGERRGGISTGHIYLLSIYGKNEADDLTQKVKGYLKKLVEAWNQ